MLARWILVAGEILPHQTSPAGRGFLPLIPHASCLMPERYSSPDNGGRPTTATWQNRLSPGRSEAHFPRRIRYRTLTFVRLAVTFIAAYSSSSTRLHYRVLYVHTHQIKIPRFQIRKAVDRAIAQMQRYSSHNRSLISQIALSELAPGWRQLCCHLVVGFHRAVVPPPSG